MRTIELDATKWKTVVDFYKALLAAIGAPAWHGISPDALVDSMIWGGINAVDPPYIVRISGLSAVPLQVRDEIQLASDILVDGRCYRKRYRGDDVDVSIVMAPASGEIEPDDQAAKIRRTVAAVKYEGPDPNLKAISEHLRRRLKPASDR
jgi:hypothetical protein